MEPLPILLTVCTNNNPGLQNLLASLEVSGWPAENVRVLGYGQKWRGFKTKMELYAKEMASLADDRIVLCIDANDVLCCRLSPSKTAEAFLAITGGSTDKLVAGMEKIAAPWNGCHIRKWFRYKRLPTDSCSLARLGHRYPFCNSGLIAGRAAVFKKMYEWVSEHDYEDDQLALAGFANAFPQNFEWDLDIRMFYNSSFLEIRPPVFTEQQPLFLHYPGIKHPASAAMRREYNRNLRTLVGHRAIVLPVHGVLQGVFLGIALSIAIFTLFAIVWMAFFAKGKKTNPKRSPGFA